MDEHLTNRPEDVQATFVATLVDEWVRGGVRSAVVCPGSRSTPLVLALADHPGVDVQVHHDERSGGFLALGLALAGGAPVVVLTTSGTATAELHPAVVEAHHAGVPLLVCTADRPPELQDVGAAQTIDQTRLYGGEVRWFADPGVPDAASAGRWRSLARRALAETLGPPPGPVQLNLPFREPLVGVAGPLPPPGPGLGAGGALASGLAPASGVAPGSDAVSVASAGVELGVGVDVGRLVGRRGVVVAGEGSGPADDVLGLADALGWPVLADPRAPAWTPHPAVVPHLDAVLRSDAARTALRPEVVLRLGPPPASRVVNEWLAGSGAEHLIVASTGWSDPDAVGTVVLRTDPAAAVVRLRSAVAGTAPDAEPAGSGMWRGHWRAAADAAQEAVAAVLAGLGGPSEPGVARAVTAALPAGAQLVISSSMPIRDVERYASPRTGLRRVLANRGANGIDGVVSTAVGAALTGTPTVLLIGDLAFLHDSNGLLGIARRPVDLVVVVVDNDGGGIFSFLPQATRLPGDRFETLFGTPHGLDLVAVATAYGVAARSVTDGGVGVGAAVAEAVAKGGVHVLVVPTDRVANVEAHRRIDAAVAAAVTAALA